MNSSENSGRCPRGPLAKFNAAAAFCDTHVHGAGFLPRFGGGGSRGKGLYDCLPTRPPEMPKAPKNPPRDHPPSEAGLPVTPDDFRAAAAAISSSVIVTECDQ